MSRLLESYNGFLGQRGITLKDRLLEYTHQPRQYVPPLPPQTKSKFNQLPPEYRRDAEEELEDVWRWYHTGMVALTTLAGIGAVYWAIKNDLFRLSKETTEAKKVAQEIEQQKDEKIDKARHRKLMGHLRAMNVFYEHAKGKVEELRREGHEAKVYEPPSQRLLSISEQLDQINRNVKKYLMTQDINSLEQAIDQFDILDKEMPDKVKEFGVLADAYKLTYTNIKKLRKGHAKSAENLQKEGASIPLPNTVTAVPSGMTVKDMRNNIGLQQTLDQELYALLPATDQQDLEKTFQKHMEDGVKLIAQLHSYADETEVKPLYGQATGRHIAVYSREGHDLRGKMNKRLQTSSKNESRIHESIWGRRPAKRIPGQMAEFL